MYIVFSGTYTVLSRMYGIRSTPERGYSLIGMDSVETGRYIKSYNV